MGMDPSHTLFLRRKKHHRVCKRYKNPLIPFFLRNQIHGETLHRNCVRVSVIPQIWTPSEPVRGEVAQSSCFLLFEIEDAAMAVLLQILKTKLRSLSSFSNHTSRSCVEWGSNDRTTSKLFPRGLETKFTNPTKESSTDSPKDANEKKTFPLGGNREGDLPLCVYAGWHLPDHFWIPWFA